MYSYNCMYIFTITTRYVSDKNNITTRISVSIPKYKDSNNSTYQIFSVYV